MAETVSPFALWKQENSNAYTPRAELMRGWLNLDSKQRRKYTEMAERRNAHRRIQEEEKQSTGRKRLVKKKRLTLEGRTVVEFRKAMTGPLRSILPDTVSDTEIKYMVKILYHRVPAWMRELCERKAAGHFTDEEMYQEVPAAVWWSTNGIDMSEPCTQKEFIEKMQERDNMKKSRNVE